MQSFVFYFPLKVGCHTRAREKIGNEHRNKRKNYNRWVRRCNLVGVETGDSGDGNNYRRLSFLDTRSKKKQKEEKNLIRFAIGTIILLLVGMILEPSSVATATPLINTTTNAGTTVYENPKYGIQLRYPQDWLYFEDANIFTRLFAVVFMSPAEALQANVQAGEIPVGLAVLITNIREPNIAGALGTGEGVPGYNFSAADIQTVGPSFLKSIISLNSFQNNNNNNNNSNIQIISTNSSAVLSHGDMPAYETVVVEPDNGTKWQYIMTLKDDWLYVLVYGGSQSRYEKLFPTAKEMINSFTITK